MATCAQRDPETARDSPRRIAGEEADAYFGEPLTRALLLANSDQVSRVELMSGLVNAVAGRLSTLRGGQGAIIDALASKLDIRLNATVSETRTRRAGGTVDGAPFDACVVATPPQSAAAICPGEMTRFAPLLERLQ